MMTRFNLAQFSFDTTVSLQTIIGLFVWVVSFIVFMTTVRDDIKTLKDWAKTTQRENDGRDAELQALGRLAERVTTLIEGLTTRIERVEQACDRRHNGGAWHNEG